MRPRENRANVKSELMKNEMTITVTITGPDVTALRCHKAARDYLERAIQTQVWSLMRVVCGLPADESEFHVKIESTERRILWRWWRLAVTRR